MRLISLMAENLYGSLNFDLEFHRDLNLLIGINGSGKTSALSVIDWLLSMNYPKLAANRYDRLSLRFENGGDIYLITAEQFRNGLTIKVESASEPFNPITFPLDLDDPLSDFEQSYGTATPEEHERKTWNFLRNLPKPTIVSLERTITAEVDDEVYYESPNIRLQRTKTQRPKNKTTPLELVQEIFAQKYAEYRKEVIKNDAELKSRIILTALHSPDFEEPTLPNVQLPQESTFTLESKVKEYLSASIPSDDVGNQVERFFNYYRSLNSELEGNAEMSGKFSDLIQSQFSRVDQLARAFNTFEQNNAKAFRRLGDYLGMVNRFLRDSGKIVFADDGRGRLVFSELVDGSPHGASRSISKLSSGETQVIILFALMAFQAAEDSVFIVDEPEISLHPKWQSEFMDSFLRLCPKNSQIFVATHSPEIVAGRKSSCVFF